MTYADRLSGWSDVLYDDDEYVTFPAWLENDEDRLELRREQADREAERRDDRRSPSGFLYACVRCEGSGVTRGWRGVGGGDVCDCRERARQ